MIAPVQRFDERVRRSLVQTYCPSYGRQLNHPILPRSSRICPARGARHFEADLQKIQRIDTPREKCLFCAGKHPSVLAMVDSKLNPCVPSEETSFSAAELWLANKDLGRIQTYYDLTSQIQPHNTLHFDHLARVFWNLTPAMVASEEACFVTAVHPSYHYEDLSTISPDVPAAMVRSWQLIEQWAVSKSLTAVPFINGGRRAASGQSVACLHGQTYVVKEVPSLFSAIRAHRDAHWGGACPICSGGLSSALRIWTDPSNTVDLFADPAPIHNWSLLVVPRNHGGSLAAVNATAFGSAIQAAVKAWHAVFGVEPALNVLIRAGSDVGHVFAELVPRTETNVLAGFELDTLDHVITVPPELVAERCEKALAAPA